MPGRLRGINHKKAKLRPSTGEITTMRIYGPNGTTLGSPASNTRRTSSTGFSLPDAPAAPEETRSAAPPKAAGSIDALLAMQGVEDPTERRKRSVARGRGALDVLDDLKLGDIPEHEGRLVGNLLGLWY